MRLRAEDMFGPASDRYDPLVPDSGMDRILVVWVDEGADLVALMHVQQDRWPHLTSLSGTIAAISCADILLESADRIRPLWLGRELDDEGRSRRDRRMAAIRPLLECRPVIFDKIERGCLIGQRHRETGIARNTLKRWLHDYFHFGRCANALIDHYDRCGHRGPRPVSADWAKLGKPAHPEIGEPHENVTLEIAKEFRTATERERKVAGEAFQIAGAHNRWVSEFCYEIREVDGRREAFRKAKYQDIEPASYGQFHYWYERENQKEATQRTILSSPVYEKDNRAITSTSTFETSGPGSRFQIDATECNFALGSSLNRFVLVGRPYLYFVRDVWSRYICGYYMGFQSPSMLAASLALMNAFTHKEALLRAFGFDPEVDPWLSHHICGALLHDGGELTGHGGDWLANELSITFEQASVDRGDLKGVVETIHHWTDVQWSRAVPGRRPSLRYRGRHIEDDVQLALAGKLKTVIEFERDLIELILRFNNKHVLNQYDVDRDMMAAGINRIPAHMWAWGVENRGAPRTLKDDYVEFKLAPRSEAKIYPQGILFQGVHFSCPELRPLQARAAAIGRAIPCVISHNFTTEAIRWHSEHAPLGYVCTPTPAYRWAANLRMEDAAALEDDRKRRERESRREEERARAIAAARQRDEAEERKADRNPAPAMTRSAAKRAKGQARAVERASELREKIPHPAGKTDRGSPEEQSAPGGNVVPFQRPVSPYALPSIEEVEDADS